MGLCEDFVATTHDSYILLERYIGDKDCVKIDKADKKLIVEAGCFTDTSLHSINLKNVDELRIGSFRNCDIEEVILPENIKEIPRLCFSGCKNLKKINLENIETVIDFAFSGCKMLKDIDLRNCKSIGACAFVDCENSNIINLENVEFINEMAFKNCKANTLTLNSIIGIKEQAFRDTTIFSLKINNECDINKSAFYGATIAKLIISKKPNFYPYVIKEELEKLKKVYIHSEFENINYETPYMFFKESMDKLLNKGFSINQINQIIKAYGKDIYMSNLSTKTSVEDLRLIRTNYNYSPVFYQELINEKSF